MWGRFTKSGLQLESVLQEPLRTDVCKTWVSAEHSLCQATLEQQTASEASRFKKDWTASEWSKVMFSDESKFCISFGYQGPRVWRKRGEAHNPRCLRSSVKFPQSVMVWGAMSSAGVGPLTWFKDHGIPVLNWPANSPDLNPTENLCGIVRRNMRYARPKNAEELEATIRATWALITPEQCHR
uniref:Tc1-like transposase DDE domain-containing protein n=1 Tax=Cyprinus carpio carpio TaxID=630221 RepID=A0A9J7Z3K5_CYPCA